MHVWIRVDLTKVITRAMELPTIEFPPDLIPIPTLLISYVSADQEWLKRLHIHLAPFVRNGIRPGIRCWDDTKVEAGSNREEAFQTQLDLSRLVMLLVSPDYLASDYINRVELPMIAEAHRRNMLEIQWIPVRPSGYENTEIDSYQWAWDPLYPLSLFDDAEVDRALARITNEIAQNLIPEDHISCCRLPPLRGHTRFATPGSIVPRKCVDAHSYEQAVLQIFQRNNIRPGQIIMTHDLYQMWFQDGYEMSELKKAIKSLLKKGVLNNVIHGYALCEGAESKKSMIAKISSFFSHAFQRRMV